MGFDRQQLRIVIVGSMLTTLVCAWMLGWGWGVTLAMAAVLIVSDMIVMRKPTKLRNWYLLRQRQPPNENNLVFQAHAASAIVLWFGEIVSLGFVAIAIFILVKAPGHWPTAVAAGGFFGLCAAFNTHLLVLRYTAPLPPSPNPVSQEKRLMGGDEG